MLMISRLTRVAWTVGAETVSIFKRRRPSISSFPVAPPENPIHFGFAPKASSAMATCAALPPGSRWTSEARLTRPTWNSSSTSRVSIAGFKLTHKKTASWRRKSASGLFIGGILFRPGCCMAKASVDRLDVRDAVRFKPLLKRVRSAPDKNAYAILPSGASAKDAAKMHAGFGREVESFIEHAVADARRKKEKRLCGCFGGAAKKIECVFAAMNESSIRSGRALHVGHGHGDAHFQNIDAIAGLRKFLHGACQNIRFAARKFRALLIHACLVRNDFKKKWNVHASAFPANTFDPGTLAIHDFRRIREGIVQQDLNAVCAGIKQSAHGPAFQQAREAAGDVGIVAADFVGH